MRYVFAVCVSIVLIILFFFSLFSISEYGVIGLILAGSSGYCLYKLYMCMYNCYKTDVSATAHSSGSNGSARQSNLFSCILFGDSTDDDPDDRSR